MSPSAEAVESRDHFIKIWNDMTLDRGGQIGAEDDLLTMWAESTFGFWNSVTLTGVDTSPDDLSKQLSRTAAFMKSKSQAGYLWLFEDFLSSQARQELFSRATEAGLELSFSGTGMAADLTIPEPQHPELEFRRVETDEELVTYGEINRLAYGMRPEAGEDALAKSEFWRRKAFAYIGYRDGRPVTCAATIGGDNTIFLALVATVPGQMRRGYGQAVSRKAIYEGIKQTGHQRVGLHATAAGRPVYERIGFPGDVTIHFFQPAQG